MLGFAASSARRFSTLRLSSFISPPMRNAQAFHEPLRPGDTAERTVGCRHTNPDICAKNRTPGVCAFVRADKVCMCPPKSWAKQFEKLKAQK